VFHFKAVIPRSGGGSGIGYAPPERTASRCEGKNHTAERGLFVSLIAWHKTCAPPWTASTGGAAESFRRRFGG